MVEVGFHSLRHTYVSIQAEHGTPQTVARWAKEGLLRQIHLGRRKVMYDAAEVAEFARTGINTQSAAGATSTTAKGQELEKNNLNGGRHA